jgi:hypothetical protein
VFDEKNQRVKYPNGVLRKLIMLIFLGMKILSNLLIQNLDVSFSMLKENLIFHRQERIDHFWNFF